MLNIRPVLKNVFTVILIAILSSHTTSVYSSSASFTAAPPFVATNVGKPNVVIALDISGSMKAVAYRDVAAGNWKTSLHDDFDPSYNYFGYFNNKLKYSYEDAVNKQFFVEDSSGNWDGNFLNWLSMRRMDVVRQVLTGGKVRDRNGEVIDGDTWYIVEGQHEPLDYTFRKSYSNSSSYSPIANDQEVLISEGSFAESTGNNVSSITLSDNVEVGTVTIDRNTRDEDGDLQEDSNWHDVTFQNTYITAPIVVATGLSYNGKHQAVARVKDVTTTGFKVRIDEWDYLDGNHTTEDIVYIVAKDTTFATHSISVGGSSYKVAAGKMVSFSSTSTNYTNMQTINLNTVFASSPVVFSGVSTHNDATPVTTRIQNITTTSFQLTLQEEEAEWNNNHGPEDVHWIAFEKVAGKSDHSGVVVEINTSSNTITHDWQTVNFTPSMFRTSPLVATNMQTFNGNNTAVTRYGNTETSTTSFSVVIEEEASLDDELDHVAETVGFLAVEEAVAYKIRLGLPNEPTGIIQENSGSIRFGLAVYNYDHTDNPTSIYNGNKIHGGTFRPCYPDISKRVSDRTNFDICLDTHVKAPLSNIIDVIEDHPLIWGTTPIAETLYDIKGYFAQTDYNRGSNSHTQWYDNGTEGITGTAGDGNPRERNSYEINNDWDPFYYSEYARRLPCAQSFVLHFNDGAPYTDFDGADNPTITDDGVGAFGENDVLDDLALELRNGDCRSEVDMAGHQEIISYYVYAALGEADSNNGSTRRMREAAANGGFVDSDNDNEPDPPHPSNFINYINTGSCTPNEWDEDGDCNPDTFYFASDGEALVQQLNAAFQSITARAGSGGASSVIAASRSGEGAVFNAIFRPSVSSGGDEVTWIGDVHALMIDAGGNLRQDDGDKVLEDAASDSYVDMCSFSEGDLREVRVKLSSTLASRPTTAQTVACSSTVFDKTLFDIQYLWSGANWLASLTDAQAVAQRGYTSTAKGRYILTGIDADNDGIVKKSEVTSFLSGTFNSSNAGLISNTLADAQNVVDFIRGKDITGYRSRQLNGQTMRLGDIIYSTPTVVGRPAENLDLLYGSTSYKTFFEHYRNRRQVVYAGGNDGMLHAFNSGWYEPSTKTFKNAKGGGANGSNLGFTLGAELWAYVPYNSLRHLEYLTRPSYGTVSSDHIYFMDLEPRIFDAKIFANDADHPGGWGTVLVAGGRLGGGRISVDMDTTAGISNRTLQSSIVIIDITNPDKAPTVLMEFSHPDLGFTTSVPTPIVVGTDNDGSGDWYLMIGSGPTADVTGFAEVSSSQQAKLFLLDLKAVAAGSSSVLASGFGSGGILTLSDSNSFISDLSSVDFGLDNFTTDAVYFGTVSGTPGNWGGKLYRIKIQEKTGAAQLGLASWTPTVVYDPARPVSAAISVSTDSFRNRWLHAGTGRFFNRQDNLNNEVNYFFGIKEPRNTSGTLTYATATKIADVTSTQVKTSDTSLTNKPSLTPALPTGATVSTLEGRMKEYSDSSNYVDGWSRDLDTGERNFGSATVFGGTVTFTTYDPEMNECTIDGESRLYVLNMMTGTAGANPIIEQGSSTYNDYVIDLGSSPATTPSIHIGDDYATDSNSKAIIQTSDGAIRMIEQDNSEKVRSGEASWRQLQ